MDFNTAQKWFQQDRIRELTESFEGLRFLKLRSLSRREHLEYLFSVAAIDPTSSKVSNLFREAFETAALDNPTIDSAIKSIYALEREQRRNCEDELVNQLYRLEVFDWGGLHQNSLERTIVDNYVKKTRDYDQLSNSIENELHNSMRSYVLCSWYNHWPSIIITLLKQWARRCKVAFSKSLSDNRLLPDLWNKASDHPSVESVELLSELSDFRQELISEAKSNPETLIQWLYENQGVRRFDASNRLFLILVDYSNFFLSWKLKRAKPLLDSAISSYLDNTPSLPGRILNFTWEGTNYTVVSDAIIITKP